jgi:predicted ester cyclase
MAEIDPDSAARTWFREVWDEGREETIDRLMARDCVAHGLGDRPIVGPDQFKPFFRMFQSAFGDLQIEVARTIVQGDMVAAHCHVVARHVGAGLGGTPTQRPVDFWGMTMLRVRGGQIVEAWNCFDFLSMYQQLGWVKERVAP